MDSTRGVTYENGLESGGTETMTTTKRNGGSMNVQFHYLHEFPHGDYPHGNVPYRVRGLVPGVGEGQNPRPHPPRSELPREYGVRYKGMIPHYDYGIEILNEQYLNCWTRGRRNNREDERGKRTPDG